MKKISEKIVFFGSGPVAAESLRLLAEYCDIEAVITKPRAQHHKGDVPVLTLAKKLNLKVYTVTNKATLNELFAGRPMQSRLAILIDFGIIVSQQVIDYFPLGIINSHFSLLPEWRGADPITFSILSGQTRTGVSLMLLTAGMDEGPLLSQATYDLEKTTTTPLLTQSLIELSDAQLQTVLPLYIKDQIKAVSQLDASISDAQEPTYSRKLVKEDGILDWNKPAVVLEREIRAFAEWPKSRAQFGSLDAVITASHVIPIEGAAGHTAIIDKLPVVYCGQHALAIDSIKPAGKKEMTGKAFLAGYKHLFLGS